MLLFLIVVITMDQDQFPEKLIPKMIFNITNNKALPVYGYGQKVENGYM